MSGGLFMRSRWRKRLENGDFFRFEKRAADAAHQLLVSGGSSRISGNSRPERGCQQSQKTLAATTKPPVRGSMYCYVENYAPAAVCRALGVQTMRLKTTLSGSRSDPERAGPWELRSAIPAEWRVFMPPQIHPPTLPRAASGNFRQFEYQPGR